MAKLSYFLVIADHNTGTFRTDEETLQAHFSDGTIFDTKTNEWEKLVEKNVVDRDVQLWNALQDGLQRVRTAPYDLRKKP